MSQNSSSLIATVSPAARRWVLTLLIILQLFVVTAAATAQVDKPRGIYAVGGASGPIERMVAQPYVDGYLLRVNWSQVEPEPGLYDFSSIDQVLAILEGYGKSLSLVVFARQAPAHVVAEANGQTYLATADDASSSETVLPWSTVGRDAWKAMVKELARHPVYDEESDTEIEFRDHPLFRQMAVQVVGLGGIRDTFGDVTMADGYERQALTKAVLTAVRVTQKQFPNQSAYLSFFGMDDDNDSPRLSDHLFNRLDKNYFGETPTLGLFTENLTCDSPMAVDAQAVYRGADRTYILFQALQSWIRPFRDASATDKCLEVEVQGDRSTAISGPAHAVRYGMETFGARYFELYKDDLLHPGFQEELSLVHDELWSE